MIIIGLATCQFRSSTVYCVHSIVYDERRTCNDAFGSLLVLLIHICRVQILPQLSSLSPLLQYNLKSLSYLHWSDECPTSAVVCYLNTKTSFSFSDKAVLLVICVVRGRRALVHNGCILFLTCLSNFNYEMTHTTRFGTRSSINDGPSRVLAIFSLFNVRFYYQARQTCYMGGLSQPVASASSRL